MLRSLDMRQPRRGCVPKHMRKDVFFRDKDRKKNVAVINSVVELNRPKNREMIDFIAVGAAKTGGRAI